MLQEKLYETKASKVFNYLELGILPAKYFILKKRMQFLKYILDEPVDTMVRNVFKSRTKNQEKVIFQS